MSKMRVIARIAPGDRRGNMESKAQAIWRWKRIGLVIVLVSASGFAWELGWALHQQIVARRWYDHVGLLILRLAPRKPDGVTSAQWASCLLHTWNLHTNYGPPAHFPRELREPFVARFEARLQGSVDLETIDWIWDEYARCVPAASNYMRYRPTTAEFMAMADEPGYTGPLESWIEQWKAREATAP